MGRARKRTLTHGLLHSSLMANPKNFELSRIGYVRSELKQRKGAPRQAWEGAPPAELEIDPAVLEGLEGIETGEEIWILTWLHEARRDVLRVHPRGCIENPEMGVFATRTASRAGTLDRRRRPD